MSSVMHLGSWLILSTFLLFSLVHHNPVLAVSTTPSTYHIASSSISTELPQSSVRNVFQAKNGALWISTLDGLSRFDGNQLINYRPYRIKRNYISSVSISRIIEAPSGDIFVATRDHGVLKYDPKTDSFSSFLSNDHKANFDFNITTAIFSGNGFIWAGHSSGGLSRIEPSSSELQFYSLNEVVSDFFQDHHGTIWFSTTEGRVYRKTTVSSEFEQVLEKTKCTDHQIEIVQISADDHNNIWLGSNGYGLFRYSLSSQTCSRVDLPSFKGYQSENSTIHEIFHDRTNESTWIASDQGVYRVGPQDKSTHFHSENSLLSNNEVTAIADGFHDFLWIGTYTGLDISKKTSFEVFDQKNNKKLKSVVAIDNSSEAETWIATYDGILILDEESGLHQELSEFLPDINFNNKRIMTVSISAPDIWIGYRSTGLEHYSSDSGLLRTYSTNEKDSLSSDAVSAILPLENGPTIIGTYGGGLNLISKSGSVESILHSNRSFSLNNNKVIMLHQSTSGDIWVGTESGLQRFDLTTKNFYTLSSHIGSSLWPDDRVVLSMKSSTDGKIWLGTLHDGLYLIQSPASSGKTHSLDHISLGGQSSRDTIYAVELDSMGNAWLSTNSGISTVNQSTKGISHFSRSNGLLETEFDFGASHKDSQGRLYFGGSNGYNRFDPASIDTNSPPPLVVLTSLNIAGREPDLPVALQDLELIELSHEDYFITFIFSALDFIDPGNNQYSYKLEGFDPEWIDNDNRNSATYTNLPSGDYVFRVRGASSAGVWNMEGVSIGLRVLPPWWLTWWAYLGYAISAWYILLLMKRYYDSRLITRRATAMAQEMQASAESANDELQDQLEIQDDLIRSVYRHNVDTLDLVREFLSLQSDHFDNDSVRESIKSNRNRLLALRYLESCLFYQGDNLYADMNKYVDAVISLALKSSHISVESITTINEASNRLVPIQWATPLAIAAYELIHNCVAHAFEETGAANYIHVSMETRPDAHTGSQDLVFTVRDNGQGMPSSISTFGSDSTGLTIVNSVADKLGGTLEISTEDGTTVKIILANAPTLLLPYGGLQKFHPEPDT